MNSIKEDDVFDYVIAYKWNEDKPWEGNTCIYRMWNSEVLTGCLENACSDLDYVNSNSSNKQYKLLRVKFEEI